MPDLPKRVPPELRHAARVARRAGWTITHTRKGGHLVWRAPSGRKVQTSGSPSDHRTVKNELARLRRAGLKDR